MSSRAAAEMPRTSASHRQCIQDRWEALRVVGCLACRKLRFRVPQRTEIHHQNAGGHAGQVRLGDRYTVPLCGWHHRRVPLAGKNEMQMAMAFGPSLASSSKAFRLQFGTDEVLLAEADKLIGWKE